MELRQSSDQVCKTIQESSAGDFRNVLGFSLCTVPSTCCLITTSDLENRGTVSTVVKHSIYRYSLDTHAMINSMTKKIMYSTCNKSDMVIYLHECISIAYMLFTHVAS